MDIKKVSKQVPHHHHHHQQQHAQKPVLHPASGSINYFRLIAQSWSAVFKSAIFQLSLLRNLLGIRAFVFAVLPLLYFQLNYILVSKPDHILNKIKAVVTAQNTSGFITLAAVGLAVVLISFLADLLIYPAITRYYYQLLGKRKPKMSRALNESMSLSYGSLASRSIKLLMFVVTAVLIAGIFYVSYILGYGDLRQMVIFSSIGLLVALIIYCLYVNFKFWTQTGFAIEGDEGEGRFLVSFRSTFGHPLGSIGFAINWLITLAFFVIVSLLLAVSEVLIVNSLDSVWYQIGTLALGTTLVYLIWTATNQGSSRKVGKVVVVR